jgi:hypothetical protein
MPSIVITYRRPPGPGKPSWWIRLERVSVENISVSVAVAAVELAFDIAPCASEEEIEEAYDQQGNVTARTRAALRAAAAKLGINPCEKKFKAAMRVYRSDYRVEPDIKLGGASGPTGGATGLGDDILGIATSGGGAARIENYRLGLTRRVIDTAEVNGQTSCEFTTYPIHGQASGRLIGQPSLPIPPLRFEGNFALWDTPFTGTLSVDYLTIYDEFEVVFPAEDAAITVWAFYHGLVADEECNPDPIERDEEWEKLCEEPPPGDSDVQPVKGAKTCYEVVTTNNECRCGGDAPDHGAEYERDVPCPGDKTCAASGPCREQVGSQTLTGYVSCPDKEFRKGSCGDVPYFLDRCCAAPSQPLPPCCSITGNFGGLSAEEMKKKTSGVAAGDSVVVVGPPPGEPCGKSIVSYEPPGGNCCDKAEDMEKVADPGVITSFADLSFTGGIPPGNAEPVVWTCTSGLHFQNGHTSYEGGQSTRVFIAPEKIECAGGHEVHATTPCGSLVWHLRNLAAPPFELKVTADLIDDDGHFIAGLARVEVTGGLPPYIVRTDGEHTHWQANGQKEITILTPGNLVLVVENGQGCDGPFDVEAYSVACGDVAYKNVGIADVPLSGVYRTTNVFGICGRYLDCPGSIYSSGVTEQFVGVTNESYWGSGQTYPDLFADDYPNDYCQSGGCTIPPLSGEQLTGWLRSGRDTIGTIQIGEVSRSAEGGTVCPHVTYYSGMVRQLNNVMLWSTYNNPTARDQALAWLRNMCGEEANISDESC